MKSYKILLKRSFIFLFVCVFSCKSQVKKEINPEIISKKEVKKIVIPKYLTKNYVLGKFDFKKHSDFIRVPKNLSFKSIYLRKDVLNMFKQMAEEAKKDGVILKIISGTRNFEYQRRIWEYKWSDKYKNVVKDKRVLKILEFSSMPCTSRHHWGTDIDINSLSNKYFTKGKGKKEYEWLVNNAKNYGFYQVYTSKEGGRTGYNEEKWHWSYVPLSSMYLRFYNENITDKDINGFNGCEFVTKMDIIKNYVNGINPEILDYKK
ncbi:MAG: M15 family metallopeptidase [Tenacibaculum sp.]|nr:M15 family metallopeptidase [Tenacibaculum sp.]